MISRPHRLSTKQFNEVIKSGKAYHSPLFLMRALLVGDGNTRIAATVPVKVGKTAVSRNALKRRMYGAIQPLLPGMKEGFQIIVLAKSIPKASTSSNDELKGDRSKDHALADDLKSLFVKAGIVR